MRVRSIQGRMLPVYAAILCKAQTSASPTPPVSQPSANPAPPASRPIGQSRLPKRYKEKLLFDLETIFQISVPGISRIVLFGSCARNELRAGSDLDLLILTLRPVPRELRGELCGILAEEKNGIATDLVFYTEEEFGRSDCRLVQEIRKDGRILWESPAESSLGG